MDFKGPVAGSSLVSTKFSANGQQTRGTHNNCGNGYTPWGTYLTTEENFIGYFARAKADDAKRSPAEIVALNRYGLKKRVQTHAMVGKRRLEVMSHKIYMTVGQRMLPVLRQQKIIVMVRNTFGWIVEIDPFDRRENPVKRTALGRFAHEDCRASRFT